MSNQKKSKSMSTSTLVKIAIMSGVAFALTSLKINLSIFPSFLDLELSEIPEIIILLTCGTVPAIFTLLIKNLLMLFTSASMGIGPVANFIVGVSYLVPLGFVYNRHKNNKNYIIGAILGTIVMTLVACVFNYFILIPAYANVLKIPLDSIIGAANAINSNITDLSLLIVYAIAPFNILKAFIFSVASYLIYKPLKPMLGYL